MRLKVICEGKPTRMLEIRIGTYSFGRSSFNSVVLNDKFVSRVHFNIIRYPDHSIVLEVLQSTNGTYLNGDKISEGGVDLSPGDEIRVGRITIQLIEEEKTILEQELTKQKPPKLALEQHVASEEISFEIPKTSFVKKTTSFVVWIAIIILVFIVTFGLVFWLVMFLGTMNYNDDANNALSGLNGLMRVYQS